MTDVVTLPRSDMQPPALGPQGAVGWMRANLFNGVINSLTTILLGAIIARVSWSLWRWLIVDGTWHPADIRKCIDGGGACWAFLQDKWRLILFGVFPYEQQWRAGLALILFFALMICTAFPFVWATSERRRWLACVWLVVLGVISVMLSGGMGLPQIESRLWSGLPLTVMLAFIGMIAAFGLAVLLALGRQSTMPVIKGLCVAYIELVRGVPLISLLFMANIMLPVVLPKDLLIPNLYRAQLAFLLFFAAYMAEIIRGGLQAIPLGQYAAAKALGLTYWQRMRTIILPQALRIIIPSLVNIFIAGFKDTSLVVYVGMTDLLGAAQASKADPKWYGLFMEAYFFIAMIYLIVCASMSWYSRWLERRLANARARM